MDQRMVKNVLQAITVWLSLTAAVPAWGQVESDQVVGFGAGFGQGPGNKVVTIKAQFTKPANDKPAQLFVEAAIEPGWHIYSITQSTEGPGPTATTINLPDPKGYQLAGKFRASPQPTSKKEKAFNDLVVETHAGKVVWYAPIELVPGTDPATLKIEGTVKAQPCTSSSCLPPTEFPFTATLGPGISVPEQKPAEAQVSPAVPALPSTKAARLEEKPAQAAPQGAAPVAFDPQAVVIAGGEDVQGAPVWVVVFWGFLGGVILNLMPCVLPVIGLKIFAFMQQAGQDRRRSLVLNLWYSAGLLLVFMVLGALAVLPGRLYGVLGFNIAMAAVVFAMGLSFLGVWEIPIPGFIGAGKAGELAQKEGAAGAFAKGVLTTLLAIPCAGPGVALAYAWISGQPRVQVFAVFTSIGLGMASPYLIIGAFPELVRFLPKPGAWTETFQHIMGFVLMGTVVYFLTFIDWPYVVPTVGLLFGIWIACWWVGRTPLTEDFQTRFRAWLTGAAMIGVSWLITIGWLSDVMRGRFEERVDRAVAGRLAEVDQTTARPGTVGAMGTPSDAEADNSPSRLPWRAFTRKTFEELVAAQKTVMVDFTADWCLNCKAVETAVLNTADVREAVEANGVVPLKADWTNGDREVTEMLDILGANGQVPVLAIFPAGNPNKPIRLLGGYTRQTLLKSLKKAGPSKPASS